MTDYKKLIDLNRQLEQLILILYKKPSKVKKVIIPIIGCVVAYQFFGVAISTYGVTSGGTAIASLSGAAKATAIMYRLGGSVAYMVMTVGTGLLGACIAYSFLMVRVRKFKDLSEEEKQIVSESSSLIRVINIEILDGLEARDITNSIIKDRLVELTSATIGYFFDYSGKPLNNRYQMRLVNVIRELRKISKKL
jgi:hypothetical protein